MISLHVDLYRFTFPDVLVRGLSLTPNKRVATIYGTTR